MVLSFHPVEDFAEGVGLLVEFVDDVLLLLGEALQQALLKRKDRTSSVLVISTRAMDAEAAFVVLRYCRDGHAAR